MDDVGLSGKQLRSILASRGVDCSDCIEKSDLLAKFMSTSNIETPKEEKSPEVGEITKQQSKIGPLQCVTVQNSLQPELVVVLSHGFGANAQDLVPLAYQILQAPSLKNKAIKIVFPNAPITLGNPGGLAWWFIDLQTLMFRVMQGQISQIINETPAGLDDARNKLEETLKEIKAQTGLPWSKFVLGGFSQGAILSIDSCLHIIDEPIGGLVIFSGSMVSAEKWKTLAEKRQKGTKILQSHGTQDPILPYLIANEMRQKFLTKYFTVDFIEFNGGHTIPPQAIPKFIQLIENI